MALCWYLGSSSLGAKSFVVFHRQGLCSAKEGGTCMYFDVTSSWRGCGAPGRLLLASVVHNLGYFVGGLHFIHHADCVSCFVCVILVVVFGAHLRRSLI